MIRTREISPRTTEILERFFVALEYLISVGKLTGLREFCEKFNLNRAKYSSLRNRTDATRYKNIEVDALAGLVDLGISAEWLLIGAGEMLQKGKAE